MNSELSCDLSAKTCKPCEGGVLPMEQAEIKRMLEAGLLAKKAAAKGLKVAKGAKVVAAVTFADRKSVTVRFTLK